MKDQSFQLLARKLEPGIVILLLLYYWNPQLPPTIESAMKYGSYALVVILFLSVVIGQWQRCAYIATRDIFPWLLLGLSYASIIWSAAPQYTSDEIDPLIRATIFGTYLAIRYTPREQIRLLAWVLGIAAVFSFLYSLAMPSLGIDGSGMWKGIFQHKQYLGRVMVIGSFTFIYLAFDDRKYRWLAWAGCGLSILLILLSQSKSALILLLISWLLLPLFKFIKQNYKLRVILVISSLLLFSCMTVLIANNLETIVVDFLGKNLEFNGRIPVWTLAIEKGLERPWLGYGYAGFWTSDHAFYVLSHSWAVINGNARMHSHNGFIDTFLQLGFVGLSLFFLSFIMLISRTFVLINATKCREFTWVFQLLIVSLLANASEVSTIANGGLMWILYVSMSLSTSIYFNRFKKYGPKYQPDLFEVQGMTTVIKPLSGKV